MEVTEKTLEWAIEWLQDAFGNRPGFPKTPRALELDARDFLDLVYNKTVGEIFAQRKEIERLASIGQKPSAWYKKHRDENDAVWLLREARRSTTFYPLPIELRRIFQLKIKPADSIEVPMEAE